MKPIDELEFTDDYMFGAVLRDEKLCKGVIERLLHIEIEKIEYPELQKEIKIGYEVHGIRLDVYVKNSDTVFDLEMQNQNYEDLGKRTRFYQSIIDADALLKGKHYIDLVESKIIFICKNDPFDKGIKCYTFENKCLECEEVEFNDKTQKLIYNASGFTDEKNKKLKAFMHFVSTGESTDEFTQSLKSKVLQIKKTENFRTEYLKMYIGMEDEKRRAVKEAVKEAVAENTISIIKKLLLSGDSPEKISKVLEIPIENVIDISKEMNLK